MIEIRQLDKEKWKNYELKFSYTTNGYYSFVVNQWNFELVFHSYKTSMNKTFTDYLFSEWLERPIAFGAFYNNQLVGIIECSFESWNNRFRITNLLVWDNYRNKGIGKILIQKAEEVAKSTKARMIILETQTCNEKAIKFYTKMGFKPIGFDLFCYSNNDPKKEEVRLEMGKQLV